MESGLKVFAPATVANVAVGYDVLGFAIEQPGDEIIVKKNNNKKGLVITEITGAQGKLSYDISKNTAGVSAQALLKHLGRENEGIEMIIHKKMPMGTGLGSSSASAVAGVFAVNELLKRPLKKRDLLPFAILGEQAADGAIHGDNVAPCLIGGMVLTRDAHIPEAHRLIIPNGLYATVIYPHIQILTKDSRAILKPTVSLEDHIQQSANIASLIVGLSKGDLDLISKSMVDKIIEPQRAHLIPEFYAVKDAALASGALACSISGAGPSIFALCANSLIAEQVGEAMSTIYKNKKIKSSLYVSPINQEGVRLL